MAFTSEKIISTSGLNRGWRRMREIKAEEAAEHATEEANLIADLGHAPSALEKTVIEMIAARVVRARRLRRNGRDDTEQARLIAQLLRSIGMKPAPVAKPSGPNLIEYLKAKHSAAPVAPNDDDCTDARTDDTPTGEPASDHGEVAP